jgi:MoxR-like ATPase
MQPAEVKILADRIKDNIQKVIVGKDEVIELMMIALLCSGHVLLEDVPGTGKTMLAKSLAASLDCTFKRIQFTPDLLPSDITGINFYSMKNSEFEFLPGPVFSSIVLADEINRATPKTQAGMLECMEEHQVTIDGITLDLESPFMVLATQNPIETQGTFPLPEAQLDRFLIKIIMQYPTHTEGVNILQRFKNTRPLKDLKPVADKQQIIEAQNSILNIFIHDDLMDYIVKIIEQSRSNENISLGISPRGSLALMRAAQAAAALNGRAYVTPDDIKHVAVPTLAHRLILKSSARIQPGADSDTINEIIKKTTVPTEDIKGWAGIA